MMGLGAGVGAVTDVGVGVIGGVVKTTGVGANTVGVCAGDVSDVGVGAVT